MVMLRRRALQQLQAWVRMGGDGAGIAAACAGRAGYSSAAPSVADSAVEAPLFKKLLVANRGEIACRVIRTARRLGIPTVAVYSDADLNAVHTRFADEAGPPPSAESYLNIDAILEAMHSTGADAVHPGYGERSCPLLTLPSCQLAARLRGPSSLPVPATACLGPHPPLPWSRTPHPHPSFHAGFLSENPQFAEAVERAGATFVGPPTAAVAAMGDKVASKQFAKQAGINAIPGWVGAVENGEHAVEVAREIGFPVVIKASAGSGQGMRIASNEKEVLEGYALTTQEAASAFGDGRVLIEKYIERPRHIEIPVLGDKQGQVVYFPESECSIRRHNQKVIEEAPSPFSTSELRHAMGEQATALCRAMGYYSAGSCAFLVDKHRDFYFLGMNTQLQAEHPITEAITRQDLVEHMLRVAAGQPLAVTQQEALDVRGWAMECHVHADSPARGQPSIRRLQWYRAPRGEGVRVDSGVLEGSEVSTYYDPLIAKVVTHGHNRAVALERMRRALDEYVIRGVRHSAPLLRSVLDTPSFFVGDFSIDLMHQYCTLPELQVPERLPLATGHEQELLAIAAMLHIDREWQLTGGRPLVGERQLVLTVKGAEGGAEGGDRRVPVTVRPASCEMVAPGHVPAERQALEVKLPDRLLQVVPSLTGNSMLMHIEVDGAPRVLQLLEPPGPRHVRLQFCGAQRTIVVESPLSAELSQYKPKPKAEKVSKVVRSPMPGKLVSVAVAVGDEVAPGDELVVVEAMKMRNSLKAGVAARVAAVEAVAGSVVTADQVIVRFE
eukprot:scaffold3.g6194.t1